MINLVLQKKRSKPSKQIRFKTLLLRSDLRDYSDAYIVVEGDITAKGANDRDKHNRNLVLRK